VIHELLKSMAELDSCNRISTIDKEAKYGFSCLYIIRRGIGKGGFASSLGASLLYLRNPCRLRNQSLGRHSPTLTAQWIAIAMNNGARADNIVVLRVYFKHIQFDRSAKGIFDGKSVIIKQLL
jgi:hypothetical protein